MISGILQNKLSVRICEDSLTSSVFDLLKYLPADLFWSILKQCLYQDVLPKSCGEIVSYQFWEKWSTSENDEVANSRYIEPDLFIRFEDFDLILEAKRYDKHQQSDNQKQDQITTYINEFSSLVESKKLYFIEVGGLHDKKASDIEIRSQIITVGKTDWTRIYQVVAKVKAEWEHVQHLSLYAASYLRILNDLTALLQKHGFYQQSWLSDLLTLTPERRFNYGRNFDALRLKRNQSILHFNHRKDYQFTYQSIPPSSRHE